MKMLTKAFVLLIFLFSTAGFVGAQNWNTSTDYDHGYTVKFPELPLSVHKNVPEGFKITDYAQSAACTYMAKIFVMNSEVRNPNAMAIKTLHEMATNLGGDVTAEEEWSHGESMGVKGQIDVPDKGEGKPALKVECIVIVVGKIQYQMVAMGPAELYEEAVAEHFLASFGLL